MTAAPARPRPWFSRLARVLSALVGVLCLLYLGIFAVGWYATYLRGAPTCVRYEVAGHADPAVVDADTIAVALAGSGLVRTKSRKYDDEWEGADSAVALYGSRAGSNIFICTRQKRSRAYQDVARRIESELLRRHVAVTASLQRDASVFGCNPGCTVAGIAVPVDFAGLNGTVLAFPAGP